MQRFGLFWRSNLPVLIRLTEPFNSPFFDQIFTPGPVGAVCNRTGSIKKDVKSNNFLKLNASEQINMTSGNFCGILIDIKK